MRFQRFDCLPLAVMLLFLSGCAETEKEPLAVAPAQQSPPVETPSPSVNKAVGNDQGTEAAPPSEKANRDKIVEATAKDFLEEFNADEKKAQEKYEGATITLSGYATDMGVMDDARGRYYGRINLSGEKIGLGVFALTKDPWDKISVPSSATIRGIGRVHGRNFFLDHAEVLNEDAVPTVRLDAKALAQEMATDPDETKQKYSGECLIVTGRVSSTTQTEHLNRDVRLMLEGTDKIPVAINYFVLDKKQFAETKVGDELTVFGEAHISNQNDEALILMHPCVNLQYLKTVGLFSGDERTVPMSTSKQ